MSDLPLAFGLLAVQLAAVGGVALLLDAWLARRCPRTAARLLLAALLAVPLLTIAMFCPLPDSWSWPRATTPAVSEAGVASADDATAHVQSSSHSGFDPLALLRMLPRVERRVESPRLGLAFAALWLLVAGIGVLRLFGGLLLVSRLGRLSQPVTDATATQMLELLRFDMGVRRFVELRGANLPGLPATAGWWRPVILLPPTWRSWSAAELRAALAHELAHIRANDFLTGLIAKLLLIPHCYHPLPRRLLTRLRLRQELAADALAAPHAGGRHEYVRALALLALRENAGAGVPHSLLLSAHGGALFRRIQMLRNTDGVRPVSRAVRGLALAVLIGSTMLAASLRGPAVEPAPKPAATESANDPFDLGYISGDTHAIACFRPAQLFAQPGMEAYAKLMRAALTAELQKEGRRLPEGLSLADIDQVVADLQLQVNASGEKDQRSITSGSGHLMVRMKKDVEWLALLKALLGDVEVKTQDGHDIFMVKWAVLGPQAMPLYALDKRTIVMVRQDKDKYVIPTRGGKTFADRLGTAWKQVERSAFAVGFDNGQGYWTSHLGPEVKDVTGMADVLKDAKSFCFGVGVEGGIDGRAFITGQDEATAKQCAAALAALCKFVATENSDVHPADKDKPENVASQKMVAEMLANGKIECSGSEVRAAGRSSVKLADLIAGLSAEAKAEKK
jgi:beta-lactamase regulating signal transducer with metallopeptidase domain